MFPVCLVVSSFNLKSSSGQIRAYFKVFPASHQLEIEISGVFQSSINGEALVILVCSSKVMYCLNLTR